MTQKITDNFGVASKQWTRFLILQLILFGLQLFYSIIPMFATLYIRLLLFKVAHSYFILLFYWFKFGPTQLPYINQI